MRVTRILRRAIGAKPMADVSVSLAAALALGLFIVMVLVIAGGHQELGSVVSRASQFGSFLPSVPRPTIPVL